MKKIIPLILIYSLLAVSSKASQLEFVDIRDHIKFKSDHAKISQIIFNSVLNDLCTYTSPTIDDLKLPDLNQCNPDMKLTMLGALGPLGKIKGKSFKVSDSRIETRENTILSIEVEEIKSFSNSNNDNALNLILLFYIHDNTQYPSSSHYYFRRVDVSVDLNKNLMTLNKVIKDIPLTKTAFSFFADAIDRKTILKDFENNITKVLPIATGSFDIRTLPGMDGYVGSMTEDLKNDAQIYIGQPGGLYKARTNKGGVYHNRPFLGIVDDQGKNYKEIAWHYKMTESDLTRAFITHGCMRTEDKDLYPMMSIVFFSGGRKIPVKVVQTFTTEPDLQDYIHLDHPMPKENSFYNFINYYDKSYLFKEKRSLVEEEALRKPRNTPLSEVERYLWCIHNGEARLNRKTKEPYILRKHGKWRSALDHYCLTKIQFKRESATSIIDIVLGKSNKTSDLIKESIARKPKIIAGLCKGSLNEASRMYLNKNKNINLPSDNRLNFPVYIANCGCKRFKEVLKTAILRVKGKILTTKDKKAEYDRLCPN